MSVLQCPQCKTHVQTQPGVNPICPNCGYSGQAAQGAASPPAGPTATPEGQSGYQQPPPTYQQPPVYRAPNQKAPPSEAIAIVALLLNILVLPGLGSLIGGKTSDGIWQIVIAVISVILMLIVIGIFTYLAAWIWGIVTGVNILREAQAAKPQPYYG